MVAPTATRPVPTELSLDCVVRISGSSIDTLASALQLCHAHYLGRPFAGFSIWPEHGYLLLVAHPGHTDCGRFEAYPDPLYAREAAGQVLGWLKALSRYSWEQWAPNPRQYEDEVWQRGFELQLKQLPRGFQLGVVVKPIWLEIEK